MKTRTKRVLFVGALVGFVSYFNRNPDRIIQEGLVSPSDGTIENIADNRIDIFIGLTDAHFQRAPISGLITDIQDFPEENINRIVINGTLTVERKGGMLARSVLTNVKIGDTVEKGAILGRILLGSHAAIYPIYNIKIAVGDHIHAGQTIG